MFENRLYHCHFIETLDEQIEEIPSHEIYAQFRESMRNVRREIQKEIYTEISSAKKTTAEIQARLTEVKQQTSIAEEITTIVTENVPPVFRKPADDAAELKSANPVAHLGRIKSQIEKNSQEFYLPGENKVKPVNKLLHIAISAASLVLKIVGGCIGAFAGPAGLKAGVKAAERCANRMHYSLFSPKKRAALNLADKAIATAKSASALHAP